MVTHSKAPHRLVTDPRLRIARTAVGFSMSTDVHDVVSADLEPLVFEILNAFGTPRTLDEAHATAATVARDVFDQAVQELIEFGALAETSETDAPADRDDAERDAYFKSYNADLHHRMLADTVRMSTFERAIQAAVGPDSRVVDFGSGTGILSLMAARAGARSVTGIERNHIVEVAREIARDNGLDDRVKYVQAEGTEFHPDGPADILISEWLGYFALHELMFEPMVAVRDRLAGLKSCIPAAVDLFLVPVRSAALVGKHRHTFWDEPVAGFDFRAMKQTVPAEQVVIPWRFVAEDCVGAPQRLCRIECLRDPVESFYFDAKVTFHMSAPAVLTGFCGYFDARLHEDIVLSTSPTSPPTHWRHAAFPTGEIAVDAGDQLEVRLTARRPPYVEYRQPKYQLGVELHKSTGL